MKKILLLMLVMVSAFAVHAEITGYRSIVFNRTNGTAVAIAMEDDMTVNIADGEVVLACAKGSFSVAISDLKYWTYSMKEGDNSQWSGVENIIGDAVNVVLSDDYVSLQNLPANSTVGLVAMDGRVIVSDKASGSYEINLSGLTRGVYVLTYNGNSLKFAVK